MQDYHIVPHTPLLFRDGRPFDAGGIAETMPFPLPSTLAGAFRTAYGDQHEVDFSSNASELLNIPIAGPLLTATTTEACGKEQHRVLLPAPANGVCLGNQNHAVIHRLMPQTLNVDEGTDLHSAEGDLLPLFLNTASQEKPYAGAPAFWALAQMEKWLLGECEELDAISAGLSAIPTELRTHVKMQNSTLTAEPGRLFQTMGLDMGEQRLNGDNGVARYGWTNQRLGFAIRSPESIEPTFRTVGGEGRLANIQPTDGLWPTCSPALEDALSNADAITLTLATPAIFNNGWLPEWLAHETLPGTSLKLKLKAVANPRWQAVSGWAMQPLNNDEKRMGARPVRRAVPAGSVYWFDVVGGDKKEVPNLWLKSISDQQSNDGFGLVLPGIWKK